MAKIINISDKLSKDKPKIKIGEKIYPVNDSMATVLEFEELATLGTSDSMMKAIELSLGKEAMAELDMISMSIGNFKVMTTAILAAMQDLTYDEAEARFLRQEQKQ